MTQDKSYSQMRKEFQEVFYKELFPFLAKYEGERKFKLLLASLSFLLLFAISLFLFYVGISSDSRKVFFKFALLMFVLALSSWCFIKKRFESKIKKEIMFKVCKCFGDLSWNVSDKFRNNSLITDSDIIPSFTSSRYDDCFVGKYEDVGYDIMESSFATGSGKNRRTVFCGVIIKLDMNKNFKGKTVIRPDSVFHTTPSAALRHTTLEDVVFEKKFDVYTDDEVEARYLITPSFMERLNNMKVAFDADKVSCAFYEQYLFVALHTSKDLFSLCSLIKPVNDGKQFFQMFEEILSIIKLIDHFKLDQKIGM